jgi:hypothetical protein
VRRFFVGHLVRARGGDDESGLADDSELRMPTSGREIIQFLIVSG